MNLLQVLVLMERYDIASRANTRWGPAVKKQLLLKLSYCLGSHWKKKWYETYEL